MGGLTFLVIGRVGGGVRGDLNFVGGVQASSHSKGGECFIQYLEFSEKQRSLLVLE